MEEQQSRALHFVCTRAEAAELIRAADKHLVGECWCRSERGPCKRSRADVCLEFAEATAAEGKGRRSATSDEALGLLKVAEEKHLVTRPFRDETRTKVDGICFCCDDCCGYFTGESDAGCDKGRFIERTDSDACTDCGACVEVCYFRARDMDGDALKVDRDKCFGCGLCLDVCPVDCIRMEDRA